ncbi:MAG: type II secretion system protein N [Nevskia sp.]|uniref:type II secretion system protein N n=1 Tax=Nevskia sp. TaxID=1929292 RepID=UPI004035CFB1
MKTRNLLLIGVLSFVGFVVAGAPVAAVWPHLAARLPSLDLAGLSGTVLAGSASAVSVNGKAVARPLHWSFSPLALLAARLGFNVQGELEGLQFDGRVARTLGGDLVVDALHGSGSLKGLLNLTGDVFLPVDGSVALSLDSLRLVGNFPKQVTGDLQLSNLRSTLTRDGQPMGDFTISIRTEADVIVARVEPTAGPLDVGGEIRVMADRSYEVDLKVKAKPEATPAIQNLVRTLGQADTEGYFRIKTRSRF